VRLEFFDCFFNMIVGDAAERESFFGVCVTRVDSWICWGVVEENLVEKLAFVSVVSDFYLVA
jgi:hypothetical protein